MYGPLPTQFSRRHLLRSVGHLKASMAALCPPKVNLVIALLALLLMLQAFNRFPLSWMIGSGYFYKTHRGNKAEPYGMFLQSVPLLFGQL